MKKILCHTVCVGTDALSGEERGFYVDYYLTETEYGAGNEICAMCYGIEIGKRYFGENVWAENASYPDLFMSERQARALARMLSENAVTPVGLEDVLEDMIAEKSMELAV